MVTYPVYVKRNAYRGSNPRQKEKAREENRHAQLIEDEVNRLIKAQTLPICNYGWMAISRATGVPEEIVRKLGFSIDCGHNGFTAIRPGLTSDQVKQAIEGKEV